MTERLLCGKFLIVLPSKPSSMGAEEVHSDPALDGYAQVKGSTWDWYINKTGKSGADRDDFEDVTDFIGWYGNYTHKTLGISKWDAYNQYLAYHEGHGGYKRKTYNNKKWLTTVARKVEWRAMKYRKQIRQCESELDSGWSRWPF